MPFYHAIVQPDLLDRDGRKQFANAVVDTHCGVTGAPRSFVHVMYTVDTDGRLPEGTSGIVRGTIRSGRNDEQKHEIHTGLQQALADLGGVPTSTIEVTTSDIAASFTMEGGQLLPEPGSAEEEEWKALGA